MLQKISQEFKILIIEDSYDDFEIYQEIINKIFVSCIIDHSRSAEEGIENLKNSKYNVILLDYNLPKMNGIDFLWALNLIQLELDCPIIAVTGSGDENTVLEFMRLGVDDYIPKSQISLQTLGNSINRAFKSFYSKKSEIDREKEMSRFSLSLAHDLKSPANRILSYSNLLIKRITDQKSAKYIENIVDDVEYMIEFIDKLLQFARFGSESIEKSVVDLNEVLSKAIKNLEEEIKEYKAEVKSNRILPKVQGDMISLVRLFQNLISNSIKYSEQDPIIEITSRIENQSITVNISDNGVGIDNCYIDKVFVPLERIDNKLNRPGTGLGLALCKSIANIHLATIDIKSENNKGTIVTITFPYILQEDNLRSDIL